MRKKKVINILFSYSFVGSELKDFIAHHIILIAINHHRRFLWQNQKTYVYQQR